MKPLSQKLGRSSNLSGRRFGRLVVQKQILGLKKHQRTWECLCDCGNTHIVNTGLLSSGGVKSCGCLQKEHWKYSSISHGLSRKPIFNSFHGANQRCREKNHPKYKDYGGRGIKVEWPSFAEFLIDMRSSYDIHVQDYGEKNTTLERIDVNGNYSKENCRWATWDEQAKNKQKTILGEYEGKVMRLTEIVKLANIDYNTAYRKYRI